MFNYDIHYLILLHHNVFVNIFIATKYHVNIFCSATWEEVNLNLSHRFIKYCCHSTQIPFPETLTSDWIVSNTDITERKEFMLANKRHSQCTFCWSQEDISGSSIRLLKNNTELEKTIKDSPQKSYINKIEIALDNICNQSCIYCNEHYSSKIADEKGIIQKFSKSTTEDIDAVVDWIETLETNRDNPTTIRFLGGEPTISKNYYNFLDRLIKTCSKKYLSIHTITNGNTPDKNLTKLKSYFDSDTKWQWSVGISNESTGSISKNIRHGVDLNQFEKNLKFYSNEDRIFFISIVMSPNIFTIKDMPNFFSYIDNILKDTNQHYGYAYNWVQDPSILNPARLPVEFKQYIQKTKELAKDTTSKLEKTSFLNYLDKLESIIGTSTLDRNKIIEWLNAVNKQKNNQLDIALLLKQL